MLTSTLIVLITALTLFLLVPQVQAKWSRRRKTVYVCDVCDARDCLCRRKR